MSVTWDGNEAKFMDRDGSEAVIRVYSEGLYIVAGDDGIYLDRGDARALAGICHQYAETGRIGPVDVPAGSPETQDIRDKMDDMDDGMTRLAARLAEMAVRMDALEKRVRRVETGTMVL